MTKRVCVIGAGPSGLTSIKICLEEYLEPICYERTDNIGGLWRFREDDIEGVSSVMKSTITNSSKELSSFSDFPPPAEFANNMHNSYVVKYLEKYADEFKLKSYIKFNHMVTKVEYAKDYNDTGRWTVRVREKDGEIEEKTFDCVLICCGLFVAPNLPKITGLDKFKGQKIHTHSYKTAKGYEDKTAVVIGVGNSGGDAAVELSHVAKKVYLSTRRGTWVSSRVSIGGYPLDFILNSRIQHHLRVYLPKNLMNTVTEVMLDNRFDHSKYGLRPNHRVFEQHVIINDEIASRIISGTVLVKDDIHTFTENGVIFKGEEDTEYPVDSVILATGYKIAFPFLSKDIIPVQDNEVTLYKFVFPPRLKHSTLAVVGLVLPFGSVLPISEMQARWITRVFKGQCQLPTRIAMLAEISKTKKSLAKSVFKSQRHTVDVGYIPYMDSIGELIGAKPNFLKIFLTNPRLFLTMYFGPCYPYQYRINGPHPWKGAVNAILTGRRRLWAPFKVRNADSNNKSCVFDVIVRVLLMLIFVMGYSLLVIFSSWFI